MIKNAEDMHYHTNLYSHFFSVTVLSHILILYHQRLVHNIARTATEQNYGGTKERGILDQAGQCRDLACPPAEASQVLLEW